MSRKPTPNAIGVARRQTWQAVWVMWFAVVIAWMGWNRPMNIIPAAEKNDCQQWCTSQGEN